MVLHGGDKNKAARSVQVSRERTTTSLRVHAARLDNDMRGAPGRDVIR